MSIVLAFQEFAAATFEGCCFLASMLFIAGQIMAIGFLQVGIWRDRREIRRLEAMRL